MKTIATAALAALLAIHAQAIQLTNEDATTTVLRIQEEEDQDDSTPELVEAAIPLIECILKDIDDDNTVKEIVSDILDKAACDDDDEEDDDEDDDDDADEDADDDDDDEE